MGTRAATVPLSDEPDLSTSEIRPLNRPIHKPFQKTIKRLLLGDIHEHFRGNVGIEPQITA